MGQQTHEDFGGGAGHSAAYESAFTGNHFHQGTRRQVPLDIPDFVGENPGMARQDAAFLFGFQFDSDVLRHFFVPERNWKRG